MATVQSTSLWSRILGAPTATLQQFKCATKDGYINRINSRDSSTGIIGILFQCNDGTLSPWYGGGEGGTREFSANGYTGWADAVSSNTGVNRIIYRKPDGTVGPQHGANRITGNPDPWTCPPGARLNAVNVSGDQTIKSLQFGYDQAATTNGTASVGGANGHQSSNTNNPDVYIPPAWYGNNTQMLLIFVFIFITLIILAMVASFVGKLNKPA